MIKLVHASISENGSINGRPGDQTGGEVCVRDMYDRGWSYVARPNDAALAVDIQTRAREAAENENIGYGQADRYGLFDYVDEFAPVTLDDVDIPVNCDCSSLITAVLAICDIYVPREMWTGVEVGMLQRTKRFEIKKYDRDMKLLGGDILIADGHTAICVNISDQDESAEPEIEYAHAFDPDRAGVYHPLTAINVRTGPGVNRRCVRAGYPGLALINYGYHEEDDRGVDWLLVMDQHGRTGWVSSRVVAREVSNDE